MTATLGAGSFPTSGYSWSVSGGEPFKEWARDDDVSTGADMTLVTDQASLHCFFRKEELSTVACSATVITPSGNLSVNAEAKVSVEAPTPVFDKLLGEVTAIGISPLPTGGYGNMKIILDAPGGLPTANQPGGMVWYATVTLPPGYTGSGRFYFMNITNKPARTITGTAGTKNLNINGIRSLDATQIYDGEDFPTGTSVSRRVYDTPDQPTSAGYEQVNISTEEYETYLMFKPPGSDVEAVPLKRMTWWWKGEIKYLGPTTTPQFRYAGQAATGPVVWREHPKWDSNTKYATFE